MSSEGKASFVVLVFFPHHMYLFCTFMSGLHLILVPSVHFYCLVMRVTVRLLFLTFCFCVSFRAVIEKYLLEKSRLVSRDKNERSWQYKNKITEAFSMSLNVIHTKGSQT